MLLLVSLRMPGILDTKSGVSIPIAIYIYIQNNIASNVYPGLRLNYFQPKGQGILDASTAYGERARYDPETISCATLFGANHVYEAKNYQSKESI